MALLCSGKSILEEDYKSAVCRIEQVLHKLSDCSAELKSIEEIVRPWEAEDHGSSPLGEMVGALYSALEEVSEIQKVRVAVQNFKSAKGVVDEGDDVKETESSEPGAEAHKRTRVSKGTKSKLLSPSKDSELCGNLSPEVLLKIYKLLLIRDFYQLRVVCKDWNRVACQRRCFSDPIPKPYFVLISQTKEDAPNGALAYNISSGRWIWRRHSSQLRFASVGQLCEPFSIEGLFFHGMHFSRGLGHPFLQTIFDIHADKQSSELPGIPPGLPESSTLGMMVDTSRRPYNFKLIIGSCDAGTLILDSVTKRWETYPSRMVRCRGFTQSSSPKSCLQCNGRMYVWSDLDEIQVYSLGEDKWSKLNSPPRHPSKKTFRGLGHWQDEIYAVTKNDQGTISVWKLLLDQLRQEWSEFERIPSDLFAYLLQPGARPPVVTTHCNEFLLLYVTHLDSKIRYKKWGRRYVLFNISTKRWEILDLPNEQMYVWRNRK